MIIVILSSSLKILRSSNIPRDMKYQMKLIESALKIRIPIDFIRIGKHFQLNVEDVTKNLQIPLPLFLLKISLTVSVNGEVNRFIYFKFYLS